MNQLALHMNIYPLEFGQARKSGIGVDRHI
jgi:hypothetical protein